MNRIQSLFRAACIASVAASVGCGSNTSPDPMSTSDAGSGNTAGATSGGGGATAQGGSATAGSPAAGAPQGGATTGGSPGTGGSGGAVGGSGGMSMGGAAGTAAGGAAGSNSAGTGGMAGSGGVASSLGCIGGACLNPECKPYKTAVAAEANPDTGFDEMPSYIPNDVIIPTLDDAPDDVSDTSTPAKGKGGWSTADLAWLDAHNLHWDLFINTDNACTFTGTSGPAGCLDAVKDVLAKHYPGNHTVHHYHLGTPPTAAAPDGCGTAACVTTEIKGVETVISALSNAARPHLTRFRAPFGEPYQEGSGAAGFNFVPAAASPFAVAVGWNLDSDDSNWDDGTNCTDANGKVTTKCPTGASVAATVEKLIKTPGTGSNYGILLMHGIFPWTHDAIPLLFDPATGYMAKNKFRIGTVEDAICWKYGKHSWEIVAAKTGQARNPN